MGWLQMSKQELRRVEVLTEVLAGSRTTESAAGVLGVSLRQAQRLAVRYRDGGGGALIHKSRGRSASNKLGAGVRELVLDPFLEPDTSNGVDHDISIEPLHIVLLQSDSVAASAKRFCHYKEIAVVLWGCAESPFFGDFHISIA